jgi:hypothetical protein
MSSFPIIDFGILLCTCCRYLLIEILIRVTVNLHNDIMSLMSVTQTSLIKKVLKNLRLLTKPLVMTLGNALCHSLSKISEKCINSHAAPLLKNHRNQKLIIWLERLDHVKIRKNSKFENNRSKIENVMYVWISKFYKQMLMGNIWTNSSETSDLFLWIFY